MHILKLLDKMYKYKMDPTRTVGATERTRDAGRTEWTQYNPQQLCCAGTIIMVSLLTDAYLCHSAQWVNSTYLFFFCSYTPTTSIPYLLMPSLLNIRSHDIKDYRKTSNIRRTLVGNKIVDHSDVVGASPVGAAPTTSSFSTWHLASRDSPKKAARQYENLLSDGIWCVL